MGEQTCVTCDTMLSVPNDFSGYVQCRKCRRKAEKEEIDKLNSEEKK